MIIKKIALFSAAISGLIPLHATITWEKTVYGEVTGTENSAIYTYDPTVILNKKNFTGSLTKTDTSSWCYDAHVTGSAGPGGWCWRNNDATWQYDYQEQKWSLVNGADAWHKTTKVWPTESIYAVTHFLAWENKATISAWSQSSMITPWGAVDAETTWINHIARAYNPETDTSWYFSRELDIQYQTFYEGWQQAENGDWVSLSFPDGTCRWRFNHENLQWQRINVASNQELSLSDEIWQIDAGAEIVTHVVLGTPTASWEHVTLNTWLNNSDDTEWSYTESGVWKNNTTQEIWEYDPTATTTGTWKNTTTNQYAYLPPLLPPLVVLQLKEIMAVLPLAQAAAAGAVTSNPELINQFELPGQNIVLDDPLPVNIKLSGTNFIVNDMAGRGEHFNFTPDIDFELITGERWQYSTTTNEVGTEYQNVSYNIGAVDTLMHHPLTDKWWRKETIQSHKWQYDVAQDEWHNPSTGAVYKYNITTNQWIEKTENDSWEYIPTPAHGWVWHNITLDENWVYKNHPNGTSGNCWWHVESDSYWQPSGSELKLIYRLPEMGRGEYDPETDTYGPSIIISPEYVGLPDITNTATLTNVDTEIEWSYNKTTKLWHPTADPDAGGVQLFPLLPGSIAGYAGEMAHTALNETDSTSTAMPSVSGLLNRLSTLEEQKLLCLEDLATAHTLIGTAAYKKTLVLMRDLTRIKTQYEALKNEFDLIYRPYTAPVLFKPKMTDNITSLFLFHEWMPTQCYFHTPGKGMFKFKITDRTKHFAIGFSTTPTTDGSADYILRHTTYGWLLYKGRPTEEERTNSTDMIGYFNANQSMPQITNETYFWCIYDNGSISLYADDLNNRFNSFIHETLPQAADIRYYSFAGSSVNDNSQSSVEVIPYPPFSTHTAIDFEQLEEELTLILFNSITPPSFTQANWSKNIFGETTGTTGNTTYSLNFNELFDSQTINGSLLKEDQSSNSVWAYDAYIKPETISGSWLWVDDEISFEYNKDTNTWQTNESPMYEWAINYKRWSTEDFPTYIPVCSWENIERTASWSLASTQTQWGVVQKNSTWINHIMFTSLDYATAVAQPRENLFFPWLGLGAWHNEAWQYNNGDWVELGRENEYRWHFNPTTSEWHQLKPYSASSSIILDGKKPITIYYPDGSFLAASERWYCDPQIETMTCRNDDAQPNQWKHIVANYWIEQVEGSLWKYSGYWHNVDENISYAYDSSITSGPAWQRGESNEYAYLPPLLPPRVVTQYHEIQNTLAEAEQASTREINENPDNLNPFELPGRTITPSSPLPAEIKLNQDAFTINDAGRGTVFGFDGDFETPNGEKWTATTSDDEIIYYQNTSTDIEDADIVTQDAATDRWWRVDSNMAHRWQYSVATNSWQNPGTGALYTYNITTQTWQQEGVDTWHYQPDPPYGWAWYNQSTEHHWIYKIHPNGTSGACWWDQEADMYWQPVGTENNPQMLNVTTGITWSYNQTTKLWHTPTNPESFGEQIFPLLPPTLAGYSSTMSYTALHETDSTSLSMPAVAGTVNRFNNLADDFEQVINNFETLQAQNNSHELQTQIPTILRSFYLINRTYTELSEQFYQLYKPYNANTIFTPDNSNTFTSWSPTNWYFHTPGQGLLSFNIDELDTEFSIGFAATPTTDGTATYVLLFTALNDAKTAYRIELKQGQTVLATVALWEPTQRRNNSFWLALDAGALSLRAGQKTNIIFEFTIESTELIQYYTFAAPHEPHISATTYPPYSKNIALHGDDYLNYLKDLSRLSATQEVWNEAKQKLNTIINSTDGYELKRRKGRDVLSFLSGEGTNTNPLAFIIDTNTAGALSSPQSNEKINYLYESMYGIKSSTEIFYAYATNLLALEATLNAILTANPAELSTEQQQALIDATIAAANNLLNIFIHGEFEQIKALSDNVYNWPQNQDIISYNNFIKEEESLLRQLQRTFLLMSPLITERFKQQTALFNENSLEAQALIAEQEALREANKTIILNLLATEVAKGSTTLFAASFAAAITFCLNAKFDSIRNATDQYLIDNNYSTAHTFREEQQNPSASMINSIYEQLHTILNAIEPIINLNGSISFPQYKGQAVTTTEIPAAVYLHSQLSAQTTQATLSAQQQYIPVGTSEYRKNTLATTAPTDITRNIIREFTIPNRAKNDTFARIYIKDALIALGNGNYSTQSNDALSVLGTTEITPDGNSIITLNSDLVIAGSNFLRPSADFGNDPENATRCIPAVPAALRGKHEIIFYSDVERSITITSGTDFDLTAFAQGLVSNGQRIVFSGKVKRMFEPNTRLRLPYTLPNEKDYGLTIAFKDDAQLIFQGAENYDTQRWESSLDGPDLLRSKILGVGTLQFNDNAQAHIMRSALVGIEADYTSNVTDITIELNNNSAWLVGDEDSPGGSFQVGNVTNNGSNNLDNDDHYPNTINHPRFGDIENPFLPRSAHIDFTLNLLGTQSRFVVGQNAFVGFGVGTVNKYGPINGTLPNQNTNPLTDEYQYHAWSVHGLYNTGNITLNMVNGTFWHQVIAPGTNINASLLAFGPLVPRCNYQLKLNKLKPTNVMGGGNVLFIRTQNSLPYDVVEDDPLASTNVTINSLPQPISIWNTIRPLVGDATDDGKYSILAAAPIIMSRQKADTGQSNIKRYGRAAIQESSTEYRFTGPLDEFYLAMTFQKLIFNNRHAIASVQDRVPTYTLADTAGVITSMPIVAKTVRTARGKVVQPTTITNNGFLRTSTFTARPKTFIKPSIN